MRFIHAADIHLDTAFVARSDDVRRRLKEASRQALRTLVDLALGEEVNAVVIAGDLFDGDRLSFQSERFLLSELERLADAGVPVVYATGNHDPGGGAKRASRLSWPDNVHIAQGRDPVRVEISDPSGLLLGSITAVGHDRTELEEDLVPFFPPPTDTGAQVAVLHATVGDSESAARHGRYAPTTLETLTRTGYHYWALGHIHVRERLAQTPGVYYAGNTQGRTLGERGAKGCLLVDMTEPAAPEVEFRRLGPVQWEDVALTDLGKIANLEALTRTVHDAWQLAAAGHRDQPEDWIVRVRLSGPSPLWRELADEESLDHLAEELRYSLGLLDASVDAKRVHPPYRVEDHVGRTDVLGEALRAIAAVRDGASGVDWVQPEALMGSPDGLDHESYVRELLDEAEGELLARMLKSGPEAP